MSDIPDGDAGPVHERLKAIDAAEVETRLEDAIQQLIYRLEDFLAVLKQEKFNEKPK